MRLNKKETGRQFVHLSGIVLVYVIIIAGKDTAFFAALILSIFLFLIGMYKGLRQYIRNTIPFRIRLFEQMEDAFFDVADSLDRRGYFPYYGAFTFYLGSAITLALFPTEIAILAIAALAMQDSISTLIGIHFGKHKLFYNKNKSVEGTLAGFAAAFLACSLLSNFSTGFVASLIGTLIESLPVRIDDNLTIPIGVAVALSLI